MSDEQVPDAPSVWVTDVSYEISALASRIAAAGTACSDATAAQVRMSCGSPLDFHSSHETLESS